MPFPSKSARLAVALVAGCTALLVACEETVAPQGVTVQVQNDVFNPATANADLGATVTWQWAAGANDHNVTWVNTTGATNSPTQSSGTYARTFSTAGTYDYYCTIHGTSTTGMRGSVVVQ
jgi:plastocyanin